METRLYVVTVYNKEDLDSLYRDIETPGGNDFVPNRMVDCSLRRPLSRNTHYYLTEEEAARLKEDPRVWDVELPPSELGLEFKKVYSQTGSFDKAIVPNSSSVNWGLLRHFESSHDPNWGYDGSTPAKTATIDYNLTGAGVDLIILDDYINGSHPDFSVNIDGTGGSRFNSLNWFQYNSTVTAFGDLDGQALPRGAYKYLAGYGDDHGTPVASCAAGSLHGIAKGASIYNINYNQPRYAKFVGNTSGSVLTITSVDPNSIAIAVGDRIQGDGITTTRTISSFGTGTGGVGTYNLNGSVSSNVTGGEFFAHYPGVWDLLVFDYIRAFAKNKTINPATGFKNPTVVNASIGLNYTIPFISITSINYRGTTYTTASPGWSSVNIESNYGVMRSYTGYHTVPAQYTAYAADLLDAADDGIIFVNASGNDNYTMEYSNGSDYNNTVTASGYGTLNYHRGDVWKQSEVVTCVGSCNNAALMKKSDFSNKGSRVDIFAAGEACACAASYSEQSYNIKSWSVSGNVATFTTSDPRDLDIDLIGQTVKIVMNTTTALNGNYTINSLTFSGTSSYIDRFTVDLTYADTANTNETGTVRGFYTSGGMFPYDPRDNAYYLSSVNGTSFAAPQIAGLLCCWLEYYRQTEYFNLGIDMLLESVYEDMNDITTIDYSNTQSLMTAQNLIAKYKEMRLTTGFVYPNNLFKNRYSGLASVLNKTHNIRYPRNRIMRYGSSVT